jgi:hypothetical protein
MSVVDRFVYLRLKRQPCLCFFRGIDQFFQRTEPVSAFDEIEKSVTNPLSQQFELLGCIGSWNKSFQWLNNSFNRVSAGRQHKGDATLPTASQFPHQLPIKSSARAI